jgi:formylglycine-generating enzyme required for sulfatase activity
MKKVFTLLAAALLAEAAFGVVLRNGFPSNGDSYTCTIKGVAFEMVFVQGGKDVYGEKVSDFWIGKFEVTQQQWTAVMKTTVNDMQELSTDGSLHGEGDSYPMYFVSWFDAQKFIDSLNVAVGGGKFRLPTEREWEYAARGGSAQEAYEYAGSDSLNLVGWYIVNSEGSGHPVGELAANGVGAYDMSGNVIEWCEDWYVVPMPVKPPDEGPDEGSYRVHRGGDWDYDARLCAVSHRNYGYPHRRSSRFGFRLACSAQ